MKMTEGELMAVMLLFYCSYHQDSLVFYAKLDAFAKVKT